MTQWGEWWGEEWGLGARPDGELGLYVDDELQDPRMTRHLVGQLVLSLTAADTLTLGRALPAGASGWKIGQSVRLTFGASTVFLGSITGRSATFAVGAETATYTCQGLRREFGKILFRHRGFPWMSANANPDDPDFDGGLADKTVAELVTIIMNDSLASLQARIPGLTWTPAEVEGWDEVPPRLSLTGVNIDEALETVLGVRPTSYWYIDVTNPAAPTMKFLDVEETSRVELTAGSDQITALDYALDFSSRKTSIVVLGPGEVWDAPVTSTPPFIEGLPPTNPLAPFGGYKVYPLGALHFPLLLPFKIGPKEGEAISFTGRRRVWNYTGTGYHPPIETGATFDFEAKTLTFEAPVYSEFTDWLGYKHYYPPEELIIAGQCADGYEVARADAPPPAPGEDAYTCEGYDTRAMTTAFKGLTIDAGEVYLDPDNWSIGPVIDEGEWWVATARSDLGEWLTGGRIHTGNPATGHDIKRVAVVGTWCFVIYDLPEIPGPGKIFHGTHVYYVAPVDSDWSSEEYWEGVAGDLLAQSNLSYATGTCSVADLRFSSPLADILGKRLAVSRTTRDLEDVELLAETPVLSVAVDPAHWRPRTSGTAVLSFGSLRRSGGALEAMRRAAWDRKREERDRERRERLRGLLERGQVGRFELNENPT